MRDRRSYLSLRSVLLALALTALLAGDATAGADPNCQCRAFGTVARLGQVVCLQLPAGPRLARCEKVLNNTSWTFLPGRCAEPT